MTDESDLPQDLAIRADELLHTQAYADVMAGMLVESLEGSGLDRDTLMLVWLAALVALDAPSESFLMNLGAASQAGVKLEQVHGVITALAPIVGTPRAVSATVKITRLLGDRTGRP
jgi:alkylhydroperoxidase/carboxymuconolactone decarboxylase family protein YurZ